MCVCIYLCLCLNRIHTKNRITENNSILFCPFVLSFMSPVGLLSVPLVCLSVLAWREAGQELFALSLNVFFNANNYFNHAPLHQFPLLVCPLRCINVVCR